MNHGIHNICTNISQEGSDTYGKVNAANEQLYVTSCRFVQEKMNNIKTKNFHEADIAYIL